MDNIDKLPDDLKRWITPFIVYDENKLVIADNPCGIMVKGKLHLLALTAGALVLVDHPFVASLPRAADRLTEALRPLETDGARTVTVGLRALQLWCGPVLTTAAEFDNDGNGPWFAPRTRSCTIFDAHIDGNLLAHALAGFPECRARAGYTGDGAVRISHRGPQEPLVFALTIGAVVLMPMSTGIARLDESGLQNPWGKEDEEGDDEDPAEAVA